MTQVDSDTTPEDSAIPDSVRVRRAPHRASYEAAVVREIVDAALVAHVGTVRDGLPVVIPMFCVRDGDSLLLHGAPASGVVRRAREGIDVCVTMTLLDGLVLARSAFHHSLNYRSVVVVGRAVTVTDEAEKDRALELFVERLVPGRQADLRPTSAKEARGTAVLRISLAQASAKIRSGPPVDDDEDYRLPIWAGVVPVGTRFGTPEPDSRLGEDVDLPENVAALENRSI